jgi:hypothetical protein
MTRLLLAIVLLATLAMPPARTLGAPGCYMRRGICVCAYQGKLYRAPKLACRMWR